MLCSEARFRSSIVASLFALVLAGGMPALLRTGLAAENGRLKLDVLDQMGTGATNRAEVMSADGTTVGTVAPGAEIILAPGDYKLVMPIVGGTITKDGLKVEPGRTTTVMITNVAVLRVSVKDRDGKDPGFPVTVTGASPPHDKLASMVSGESILMAPNQVDVKVDAPPQGYFWHAVEVRSRQPRRPDAQRGRSGRLARPADLVGAGDGQVYPRRDLQSRYAAAGRGERACPGASLQA